MTLFGNGKTFYGNSSKNIVSRSEIREAMPVFCARLPRYKLSDLILHSNIVIKLSNFYVCMVS